MEKQVKKGNIVFDIVFYIILIVAIVGAIIFTRGEARGSGIRGYHIFEVLSRSMESVYPKGSLVVVKKTNPSELVIGDDITFVNKSGILVTHRIIEIDSETFVTKGVDNASADKDVVLGDNVVGKVVMGIPQLGRIFSWFEENLWSVLALFLFLMTVRYCVKIFRRKMKDHKKDKNALE